ncbi:hypothetical protein [Microbacterium sp. CPCC 204701]|uniref:hypothetical protein n=1 Tax=Microbacterium sp. CPCC 204701 TaxID=2493084 RepID=UPI0013E2C136|nr:hypothetical protein [Microbacterium sp. CPCC 204701]
MADQRPPSTRRTRRYVLPALISAVVLVPNAVVIALGVEDFPFTSAPMFAHHIGPDTRLYAFRLEAVRDGASEPFPLEMTNLDPLELKRQLASWYYRPMSDTSPFRDLSGDSSSPEVFDDRMATFFRPLTDFLRDERGIEYDGVNLYVDTVDSSGELLESEHVGYYETATRRYTQTAEVLR